MGDSPFEASRSTLDSGNPVGYAGVSGRRDEAVSPAGGLEPEWGELFESMGRHGLGVLEEWRSSAARHSRERGLAYRGASADDEVEAGWSLDPIPWIISSQKWEQIEAGVGQRLRLYEQILHDLYGPRRMLRERLAPAEIIFGNPGFLRALHDLEPGRGVVGLGMSAFDLARDASGRIFVLNDRFDCPFGLGLALENRTVVNKVLPRLFRRCGVRRIGQFFIDWFDFLLAQAPGEPAMPQVVVLDEEGEEDDDSEIGFLANYCGILRVRPSDLTVRGGKVWIKSLRGLVPVDVIWKATAGRGIDSLESEGDHSGGIAGLFEAMRVGGVVLASHPGAGALQSTALYPFLPGLCRAFLGEEPIVHPVATWWCGERQALSYVLDNLPAMVVKSSRDYREFGTCYGSRMSAAELDALRDRIRADPGGFVGQEELSISTVPTSQPGFLGPRSSVLRVFSFLGEDARPRVMPGGVARVSTEDGFVISTRGRGESKDVWVRSPREEEPFSIASVMSRSLPAAPDIVPSRTGENLFWTGRHAERTQVASRFAARIIDGRSRGFSHDWQFEAEHERQLIRALYGVFKCQPPPADGGDGVVEAVLRDPSCPAGILFHLERLYRATQATREAWSPASILAIESCHEGWKAALGREHSYFGLDSDLDELELNLSAFLGLNLDSMTRDEGWALLDAGRRIERAAIVCELLRFLLEAEVDGDMSTLLNESFLYILDSVRTYQSRHHAAPETGLTTALLFGEPDYPRSVVHLLERLREVLAKLPDPCDGRHPSEEVAQRVESFRGLARNVGATVGGETFDSREAAEAARDMQAFLSRLSDRLTVSYFSHAPESA